MSADLLDQLAAYGAEERATRPPIGLDAVVGGDRSRDGDEADSVDVTALRSDRSGPGSDRRVMITLTAAAMVVAVVGLIAVLAVVRDGPTDMSEADSPSGASSGAAVELFRVNADAAAYWRLTTLPEYDGERFRVPRRALEPIEGVVSLGSIGEQRIRQQVQILALDGQLVPAAAEPFQATGFSGADGITISLNRETSTLVASDELAPDDLFTIISSAPQPSVDVLRASATDAPDPLLLALPDDLPAVFADLAVDVTDGATTSYDSALAIQNWFRTSFELRADAVDGQSIDDLDEFIMGRAGEAEQFAATFAVMARSIGLPTRVAVGYTAGVLNREGWYSVTAAHSHAWPEVWFDAVGWIAFEPTPGRGIPGAEAVTGVPARQDVATPTPSPDDSGPDAP